MKVACPSPSTSNATRILMRPPPTTNNRRAPSPERREGSRGSGLGSGWKSTEARCRLWTAKRRKVPGDPSLRSGLGAGNDRKCRRRVINRQILRATQAINSAALPARAAVQILLGHGLHLPLTMREQAVPRSVANTSFRGWHSPERAWKTGIIHNARTIAAQFSSWLCSAPKDSPFEPIDTARAGMFLQ